MLKPTATPWEPPSQHRFEPQRGDMRLVPIDCAPLGLACHSRHFPRALPWALSSNAVGVKHTIVVFRSAKERAFAERKTILAHSKGPPMPDIRNRIKAHRRVRAGDFVPHELNFRHHPERQRSC